MNFVPRSAVDPATYNVNLACHRAKRSARELVNVGVSESRIHIASRGTTQRFGTGTNNPANRVVQVHADAPAAQADNLPANPTTDQVIEAARQRILRREYNVAADGYLARWTCGPH